MFRNHLSLNTSKGLFQMFDSIHDLLNESAGQINVQKSFRSDVLEKNDRYEIECELPGFKKDSVEIHYLNNYLTIIAKTNQSNEEKQEERILIKERLNTNLTRTFYIENIDDSSISAKLEDGILKIKLPKKQVTQHKKIQID